MCRLVPIWAGQPGLDAAGLSSITVISPKWPSTRDPRGSFFPPQEIPGGFGPRLSPPLRTTHRSPPKLAGAERAEPRGASSLAGALVGETFARTLGRVFSHRPKLEEIRPTEGKNGWGLGSPTRPSPGGGSLHRERRVRSEFVGASCQGARPGGRGPGARWGDRRPGVPPHGILTRNPWRPSPAAGAGAGRDQLPGPYSGGRRRWNRTPLPPDDITTYSQKTHWGGEFSAEGQELPGTLGNGKPWGMAAVGVPAFGGAQRPRRRPKPKGRRGKAAGELGSAVGRGEGCPGALAWATTRLSRPAS